MSKSSWEHRSDLYLRPRQTHTHTLTLKMHTNQQHKLSIIIFSTEPNKNALVEIQIWQAKTKFELISDVYLSVPSIPFNFYTQQHWTNVLWFWLLPRQTIHSKDDKKLKNIEASVVKYWVIGLYGRGKFSNLGMPLNAAPSYATHCLQLSFSKTLLTLTRNRTGCGQADRLAMFSIHLCHLVDIPPRTIFQTFRVLENSVK